MADLETMMSQPGFWDNPETAQVTVVKLKAVKAIVDPMGQMLARIDDIQTLHELAVEMDSDDDLTEVGTEIEKLEKDLGALELKTLLSGAHDAGNCYFSIHAGAGGTESCDWAAMLSRQYLRYFERNGFKVSEVDRTDGEEAGIRSVTYHVTGPYGYGYLACERGVHRLVRVSPFDSQGRRHTSFAAVDVLPELADIEVDVDWATEVREDVFHSSGPGGQNVNKVASAIRLTHDGGIVVQCQNEASQHKNRAEARKMLMAKLYQAEQAKRDAELAKLYGNKGEIAFGNHIRSYVLYPYQLVRDERTGLKSAATDKILDGDIQDYIDAFLRFRAGQWDGPVDDGDND
jgi:peptide chain release factor 2